MEKLLPYLKTEESKKAAETVVTSVQAMFKSGNMQHMLNPECVKHVNEDYKFKENDIVIVTFPKTGTNWAANFLKRLLYTDEEMAAYETCSLAWWAFEMAVKEKFQVFDALPLKRRIFITHLSGNVLNKENLKKQNVKIIYMLRNPKDQIVSQFNFFSKLMKDQPDTNPMKQMVSQGWDAFFTHALNGDFPVDGNRPPAKSKYADHILSWLPKEGDDHVQLVYYEDLKEDFAPELKKIAAFLGVEVDEAKIAQVQGGSSIESMRKEYQSKKDIMPGAAQGALVNKGSVGDWKNHLSEEQSKSVDKEFEEKLKGTGITFKYQL